MYFYKIVVTIYQLKICNLNFVDAHVSHLENTEEEELNRLLGIVVDVENLFMCVAKEEDADTKQVYFYLFKVSLLMQGLQRAGTIILYTSPMIKTEDCIY